MEITDVRKYITENEERFLNELISLLKIPSVSADSAYDKDTQRCAEHVKQSLLDVGVDMAEICQTDGHPIVYAEKMIDPAKPTILVYGHYDVQPADPVELWSSAPFDPEIRDGKIFARGSADDKGQFYMHVKAFEMMNKMDALPCNVKFMIEGEEEVGSSNLGHFVKANKEKLKADVIVISDTSIIDNDTPSITVGLRGLSYVEVEVTGPSKDLHSGVYGGAVDNPVNVLCEMIASLKDENGSITVDGFYDKVEIVSAEDRAMMAEAPFDLKDYMKALDVDAVRPEAGYSAREGTSIRPSLDVNGIWGGYIGEGAKTVLPSKAYAKISMRLVPHQEPDEITALFDAHFRKIAPKSVKINVTAHHGGEPVVIPTDNPGYQAASLAMEKTFGKRPIPERGGGSIPIVALFEKELGLKSILMGFGLDSDDIHSPDEHYGIFNYLKGIETIPFFHKYFAELSAK
jgi:acetylornithine deacetylase/succinyl-diaminopimelate desuccinylase-like protein